MIRTLCQISKDTVAPPKRCSASQPISLHQVALTSLDRIVSPVLRSLPRLLTRPFPRNALPSRFDSHLHLSKSRIRFRSSVPPTAEITAAQPAAICEVDESPEGHQTYLASPAPPASSCAGDRQVSGRESDSSVAGSTFLLSSRLTCSLEPFSRVRHCICPSNRVNSHSRKTSLRPINDRKGDISDAFGCCKRRGKA